MQRIIVGQCREAENHCWTVQRCKESLFDSAENNCWRHRCSASLFDSIRHQLLLGTLGADDVLSIRDEALAHHA